MRHIKPERTRSLPLQSAGDGGVAHLDRAVGGEDAQRLARTLVHAHVQRHPIHVQRADGVVDDETDVVRMPRLEADGPFQADVYDVNWSCSSSPPRGTATPQSR